MFTVSTRKFLDDLKIPLRLACTNSEGWPIVLSLWYVHLDGSLYLATQEDAQVVGFLRANPDCGYEVAADTLPYKNAIAGRASLAPLFVLNR